MQAEIATSRGWGATVAEVSTLAQAIFQAERSPGFLSSPGTGELPLSVPAVRETGEYHPYKNIRRYITPAPLGVEVFSWCCGYCFVYRLSGSNQCLDALPDLHEHVTIVLEI